MVPGCPEKEDRVGGGEAVRAVRQRGQAARLQQGAVHRVARARQQPPSPVRPAAPRPGPPRCRPGRRAATALTTASPPPPTNTASGSGSPARASGAAPPTTRTSARCRRALAVTRAHCAGSRSTAITAAPNRAHSTATEPEPAPTSHTRVPGRGPSRASARARTSGLVTIESRCSNASSPSAHPSSPMPGHNGQHQLAPAPAESRVIPETPGAAGLAVPLRDHGIAVALTPAIP